MGGSVTALPPQTLQAPPPLFFFCCTSQCVLIFHASMLLAVMHPKTFSAVTQAPWSFSILVPICTAVHQQLECGHRRGCLWAITSSSLIASPPSSNVRFYKTKPQTPPRHWSISSSEDRLRIVSLFLCTQKLRNEPKVIIVNIYANIIVNIYDNPSGM